MKRNHLNDFLVEQIKNKDSQIEGLNQLISSLIEKIESLEMHIPADTRSAFPVISVQSPVSIQCCWQS
jgi:hypothetical protein